MDVTFKPLSDWPKDVSENRQLSQFKADWQDTLDLLRYEIGRLGAGSVVVSADFKERDIRKDGWFRSDARNPAFPGVVVEWQLEDRWFRMAADKYTHWKENMRAVALSLKALRDVERWGAVEGQQYEGLRLELEAQGSPGSFGSSTSAARKLLDSYGGLTKAIKATHPDQGGHPEAFNRVMEARRILGW